jgi:hypothetical protein
VVNFSRRRRSDSGVPARTSRSDDASGRRGSGAATVWSPRVTATTVTPKRLRQFELGERAAGPSRHGG